MLVRVEVQLPACHPHWQEHRLGVGSEAASPNQTPPVPQKAPAYFMAPRDLHEARAGPLRLSNDPKACPQRASDAAVQPGDDLHPNSLPMNLTTLIGVRP